MSSAGGTTTRRSRPTGKPARSREELRVVAREAMGLGGGDVATEPLQAAIARSGVGWYPLLTLGALVLAVELFDFGFIVFAPDISRAFGVDKNTFAALTALKTLALSVASLPMAAYVQKVPRRALVSVVTAFCWSVAMLMAVYAANVVALLGVLVIAGASMASARAVHPALLVDSYPPAVRVRALSIHRAATAIGSVLAPLMVAVLSSRMGLTWRGVFLFSGVVSLVIAVASVRLRDPGFGRWDAQRVRDTVAVGPDASRPSEHDVALGFFEIVQRLMVIPTVRRLLMGNAVLGMLLIPLNTYLLFFLEERWGLSAGGRAFLFGAISVVSVFGLLVFGRRGDEMFQRDPASLVRLGGVLLAAGVTLLALSMFAPVFALMVVLLAASFTVFAVMGPMLATTLLSIVPPRMRPHASALQGIFLAGVGGVAGLVLLGGIDRRYGTAGAIVSLVIPGAIGGLVIRSAQKTVGADLDRMVDEILEEEEVRSSRTTPALLDCRRLNFAYGHHQVLFEVDFSVRECEMVALLGTNGAGKSTLLRAVSGLGLPTSGSIRFRGSDITFVDAERRVHLGIIQVLGGRAIFGPLPVIDNLRLFGYTFGRNRRQVDRAIETSFETFPKLHELRNQNAATLSGGEQQMLALAKALVLEPSILLIDELSLGLAPKVVQELLAMVRLINERGAAVVLVEQSVNIALSVTSHAYFMEKGEIRFDGPAADLVARTDLLRSVFLKGAAATVEGPDGGAVRLAVATGSGRPRSRQVGERT